MVPAVFDQVGVGGSHVGHSADRLLILRDGVDGEGGGAELGEYHLPCEELLEVLRGQFDRDIDQEHEEGGLVGEEAIAPYAFTLRLHSVSDAFFVLEAVDLVHLDVAEPEPHAVLHGPAVVVVASEHEVVAEPWAGQFLPDFEEGKVLLLLQMQVINNVKDVAVLGYPQDVDVSLVERYIDFAVIKALYLLLEQFSSDLAAAVQRNGLLISQVLLDDDELFCVVADVPESHLLPLGQVEQLVAVQALAGHRVQLLRPELLHKWQGLELLCELLALLEGEQVVEDFMGDDQKGSDGLLVDVELVKLSFLLLQLIQEVYYVGLVAAKDQLCHSQEGNVLSAYLGEDPEETVELEPQQLCVPVQLHLCNPALEDELHVGSGQFACVVQHSVAERGRIDVMNEPLLDDHLPLRLGRALLEGKVLL